MVKNEHRGITMTIHDPRYSDVIIIGGGATGAGIARDCALRGLSVTLL